MILLLLILFEIYFCTNFSIFRTLADDEGLMSELNSHLAAYTFHIFHYFSWRVREKVREGGKHPHYYPSAVSKSPLDCSPPLKKRNFWEKNMKINTITNFFFCIYAHVLQLQGFERQEVSMVAGNWKVIGSIDFLGGRRDFPQSWLFDPTKSRKLLPEIFFLLHLLLEHKK